MTGVDWPGKSAVHNALLTSIRSGRFFSLEAPFWFGPRQVSQPCTGAECVTERAAKRQSAAGLRAPTADEREIFMVVLRSQSSTSLLKEQNKFSFLNGGDYSTSKER